MPDTMPDAVPPAARTYVDVAQAQVAAAETAAMAGEGPLFMLNLLRFRPVADYAHAPHLAPPAPISGAEAYALYMRLCEPRLKARGDEVTLLGRCAPYLIGPPEERWDAVLIIRRPNFASMIGGMADDDYPARIAPHRTAALADSRLLPMIEGPLLP